jgi:hypothetical protein
MGDDTQPSTTQDGTKTSGSLTLMSLPTEIRYKIWTEVLGCRTIHLSYQPPSYAHSASNKIVASDPEKWSHYVCVSQLSEKDIYQRFLGNPTEHNPYLQQGHLSWEDCEYHHEECQYPRSRSRVYISLALLRVNKTIHAEADHALLATNLFSIDDELCFKAFFAHLSPERGALVAKLHLSINWTNVVEDPYGPYGPRRSKSCLNQWNARMNPELISQLTGLRTLHVCMAQGFYEQKYLRTMKDMDLEWVGGMCNFKVLGKQLKTLTLALTDAHWAKTLLSASFRKQESIETKYRWTVKERQDFCERLRRRILD